MIKIMTWNVNSIHARLDHLKKCLIEHQPEVICLQELKCEDSRFPTEEIKSLGYQASYLGQKRYNGVCILSKQNPQKVIYGFESSLLDCGSRVITCIFNKFVVVCCYAPNGRGLHTYHFEEKMAWYDSLYHFIRNISHQKLDIVIAGDFNIVPTPRDSYNPDHLEGGIFHSKRERNSLLSICFFVRPALITLSPGSITSTAIPSR